MTKIRHNKQLINSSDHPLHKTWSNIIDRTTNKANKGYAINKARNVSICKRWKNSFIHFLADMGQRPSYFHYLKRHNNYKDYNISNCYWGMRTNTPTTTAQQPAKQSGPSLF